MINRKRLLWAYIATLVADNVYGFLVFGMALGSFHARYPTWLKSQAELPILRMFLTGALNLALVSLFYALFARGRSRRLSTGVVFGLLLGSIAGWVPQAMNQLLFVNYPFYARWAPAIFAEFLLMGIVLGCVYRE
ncbi:MAG TPA: hypothetical protein VKE24_16915 [Candidatus Acidoferrales bacterium]|nr:hypothetical protein [Candidatus Acidoferrales bacterium]